MSSLLYMPNKVKKPNFERFKQNISAYLFKVIEKIKGFRFKTNIKTNKTNRRDENHQKYIFSQRNFLVLLMCYIDLGRQIKREECNVEGIGLF